MRKITFIVLSCISLCIYLTNSVQARTRVIEEVEIVEQPTGAEIHIFFNAFFQYQAHVPTSQGDFLQIELRPIDTRGFDVTDLLVDESVNWLPTEEVPLQEITYEGFSSFLLSDFQDSSNRLGVKDIDSTLKLRFNKDVEFKVETSIDLRSIVVFVPKKLTIHPDKIKKVIKKEKIESAKAAEEEKLTGLYVIQIKSALAEDKKAGVPDKQEIMGKHLYVSEYEVDGQIWHRWRLGFFESEKQAQEMLVELKKNFPDSWIVQITESERDQYAPELIVSTSKDQVQKRKVRPLSPERLTSLTEEADKEMTAENYSRAIQLYGRILQHPDPVHQQRALEMLGLARERKGQLAHAKSLYEEYLATFPEGEGVERVRQRLTGMLTARAQPKEKLRRARQRPDEKAWERDIFGSIAQYYSYDESKTAGVKTENINALTSDADLNFRLRNKDYDIQAAFVGSNDNDFTDTSDDVARISVINFDFLNRKYGVYGRIGRQSVNTGGVLGRFDGAMASYEITPNIKINTVFGYPVSSTTEKKIDKTQEFYGVNFDLGTFRESWDYNVFFIEQRIASVVDRQAVGGEARYYKSNLSFFSLVDYDIFYDKLNTLLLNGNWRVKDSTTLNIQADYRLSPTLLTSNALQGQSVETIDLLKNTYSESEIFQLAEDRTAETTSILLGITHDFNEKWQIYSDVTQTEFKSTVASGGVSEVPGTGEEYYYNLQFIGSSLIREGDTAILGLRYSDTSTRKTTSFSANGRYPITRNFRVNPRILYEYRSEDDSSGDQSKIRPSLRIDYRFKKNLRLELDGGYEYTNTDTNGTTSNTRRYFVLLSYRWIF